MQISKGRKVQCDKSWSLTDRHYGARTCEEITKHSRAKQYNCKSCPLFDFIPMNHVIIDILQLFLRISDNLFELLIRKLGCVASVSMGLESKESQRNGFAWEKHRKSPSSVFLCSQTPRKCLLHSLCRMGLIKRKLFLVASRSWS